MEHTFDIKTITSMIIQDLKIRKELLIAELVKNASILVDFLEHDNWNGGINYYKLSLYLKYIDYSKIIEVDKKRYEDSIFHSLNSVYKDDREVITVVEILPLQEQYIDWDSVRLSENKKTLIEKLNNEKKYLSDVATGIRKIEEVNSEYQKLHKYLDDILKKMLLEHVIVFDSLWDWYSFYKEKKMETYQSRRDYLSEKYNTIISVINNSDDAEISAITYEPTGWEKIDESIKIMQKNFSQAADRIDYNQIGLRCRETIILLAQQVYVEGIHHPVSFPGQISKSDAKRMLEGYIEFNLSGGENEEKRKYSKAANDLANNLTHKSSASQFDAELCYVATTSLLNIIRIIHKYHK